MIDYRIEVGNAHAHRFQVTMRVTRPQIGQKLSLPVWIPGSYLVREFARHLSPIEATQGGQPVRVTPLDKCTWQIDNEGHGPLTLRYEVYAFDNSVRTAFLDTRRGFFNGTSVFLKAEGFEDQAHGVKICGMPKAWSVATALTPVKVNAQGWGEYEARDYDALVDHPVELGAFWHGEFTVRGVRHEFVVAGATEDFDGQRLLDDTRRICEAQISFWHGRRKVPFDHYVFMLNVVDDGYGGLEHRQSTALICGRRDLPRTSHPLNQDSYTTLLGLISHEYFHTWNVKRLKPVAFTPYDYTQENHTRMLWFFEGFTSYYDDQFLLRTGLIDAPTYLKLLSKTINQVLSTPGRLAYSVGQASFDAWTRYYRQDENTANATVSYYTKGSLVALALDLTLRQLPAPVGAVHSPSLDGVMRRLFQLGRAITQADVAQALADEAGQAPPAQVYTPPDSADTVACWMALLDAWTEGCEDLPLQALLVTQGLDWHAQAGSLPQRLGVRVGERGGAQQVLAVMHGSVGEQMGLSAGDELLALGEWRIKRADDLAQWHQPNHAQTVLVSRDQRVLTLTLPVLPKAGGETVALALGSATGDAQALTRRAVWLKA